MEMGRYVGWDGGMKEREGAGLWNVWVLIVDSAQNRAPRDSFGEYRDAYSAARLDVFVSGG
jgi:hypothetical protein